MTLLVTCHVSSGLATIRIPLSLPLFYFRQAYYTHDLNNVVRKPTEPTSLVNNFATIAQHQYNLRVLCVQTKYAVRKDVIYPTAESVLSARGGFSSGKYVLL